MYLADENLNFTVETELKLFGVTVWGALSSEGVVVPVFLWTSKWGELSGHVS